MDQSVPAKSHVDRRQFLRRGLCAALVAAPLPAWANALGTAKRRLSFVNLHTDEKLTAVYWANGSYQRNAVKDISYLLRDFRSGDVYPIDLRLFDLLYTLQHKVRSQAPFQVISGYRSPVTNAKLASHSGGVARRSYHMKGMAIDVALADSKLSGLRDAAVALQSGGVGYYPKPGFVHVDVGPVRTW